MPPPVATRWDAAAAAAQAAAGMVTAKTPERFASRVLRDLPDFCAVMILRPWHGRGPEDPPPQGLLAPTQEEGEGVAVDPDENAIAANVGQRQALLILADLAEESEQRAAQTLVFRACQAVPEDCCVILALLPRPGTIGGEAGGNLDEASRLFEAALELGADEVISDPPWNTAELKVMVSIACHRWRRSTAKSQLTLELEPKPPEDEHAALEATRCSLLFGEVRRQLMQQLPPVNINLAEGVGSVGGRYTFLRTLSTGQCGVFEARDTQEGDIVAVKVTKKADIWNMNYFDGLYREYLLLKTKLQHKSIVRCREVLHGPTCIYHILDYAGDQNLEQVLQSRTPVGAAEGAGRLEAEEVDLCFEQIGDGLRHCHNRGLSHRRLEPHHIVVTWSGNGAFRCTLVDFRSALSGSEGQLGQMRHGRMPCMAPEMMANLPHDPLCVDRWSLGAVLVEMMAGRAALSEAVGWDGQTEPSDATAAAARAGFATRGVPARVAARFGARPSARALKAAEAFLRPEPAERSTVSSVLDAFCGSPDGGD